MSAYFLFSLKKHLTHHLKPVMIIDLIAVLLVNRINYLHDNFQNH